MLFKKSEIKKILVVSLSNPGDVILTFPVVDILLENFPDAPLSVVAGEKAKEFFTGNPFIQNVYVFNKKSSSWDKLSWVLHLRRERFDLIVDLRNTAIPFFAGGQYRTSYRMSKKPLMHMKEKHLNRLRTVLDFSHESRTRRAIYITAQDKKFVDDVFKSGIGEGETFVVVSPGAANHIKRWREEGFARVCESLAARHKAKIVFVGDQNDRALARSIAAQMKHPVVDLTAQTTLLQLAEVIHRAKLVIANDSAVMHLASYLNVPTLAIFGPTDEHKYGPWSDRSWVVRKNLFCSPCEKSGCAYHHECMEEIRSEEVLSVLEKNFL